MQPGVEIRMKSAIDYLEQLLRTSSSEIPFVIFLQEMCISDLESLRRTTWVQGKFCMTNVDESNWKENYGTTTLVDRRLVISNVFRNYYKSEFGRDGLFVDLKIGRRIKTLLRLCNTHLESLISDPPLRPEKMALVAQYLHADNVHAGVLAGDCNAIQPFDRTLDVDNDFQDAFLALEGEEGQEEGFTWGYQSEEYEMEMFGRSRMDKVLFCGKVAVNGIERIGLGAKVDEGKRKELRRLTGGLNWIADHYGLAVTLNIIP